MKNEIAKFSQEEIKGMITKSIQKEKLEDILEVFKNCDFVTYNNNTLKVHCDITNSHFEIGHGVIFFSLNSSDELNISQICLNYKCVNGYMYTHVYTLEEFRLKSQLYRKTKDVDVLFYNSKSRNNKSSFIAYDFNGQDLGSKKSINKLVNEIEEIIEHSASPLKEFVSSDVYESYLKWQKNNLCHYLAKYEDDDAHINRS